MDGEIKAIIDGIQAEDTRQNHRLEKLEDEVKSIHDIATSIEKLTIEIKHMSEALQLQSARLDKIESAPLDRMNNARNTAITTIVSLVVGAVVSALIMLIKNGG